MPLHPTATSTALLHGLERADHTAWDGFVSRYRPVVVAYARRFGLGATDAEDAAQEVLAAFAPSAMAIEELFSHYERPRTSILMGHARGVICLAAAQAQTPIVHYAATQVKKTLTGNGRAPKSQVQNAICREFGLSKPPEPPDVADALAIALCHYYLSRTMAQIDQCRQDDVNKLQN